MPDKALITGANKGIGFELARQLGRLGWTVLLGARDEGRGRDAAAALKKEGIAVEWIRVDLNDPDTIREAAKAVQDGHPDLNLLINNAGIPGDMRKPGYEFDLAELREVVEVNLFGSFAMTKAFLPILSKNRGRILNLTIPTGGGPHWNPFAYRTSKAALNAMIQSLGVSFEKNGVPVEIFGIMPGGVTTDLNNNSTGPHMKTVSQGGKVIVDLLTDGRNYQGKIIDERGASGGT